MTQTHHIPDVTTLSTLKARILASCQTALVETDERISQGEVTEETLRRDLEEQLTRTAFPWQEVMIPARRVYACLTSVTQAFSSHAYAVESVLHERLPDLRDVFETFFRVQETIHDMLESLPASEVAPDTAELDALTNLLDKWLSLTGTVDSDIARYPVWRHIQELI